MESITESNNASSTGSQSKPMADLPKNSASNGFFFGDLSDPNNPDLRDWLAAIVEGSDDAIISKDLQGRIQSWNGGATRLFGYTAEEAIGQPITILIPPDRLDEEPKILAQIRQGKLVDHFETVRRHKDGSPLHISLTISPIRNRNGVIVGASKIARDISERLHAEEQQRLLIGEMQHRIKNLFSLAAGIVSLSAKSACNKEEVIQAIQARLSALARAHELTIQDWENESALPAPTDLLSLMQTILKPHEGENRIIIRGATIAVGPKALTNLALLLYELATNAVKYGCLSVPNGQLLVELEAGYDNLILRWHEQNGPAPSELTTTGFGSRLERGLASALNATIDRDWQECGLVVTITIPIQPGEFDQVRTL